MTATDKRKLLKLGLSVLSVLMVVFIFLFGFFLPKGLNWGAAMLFMVVFIALIGQLITGRVSGIFINERFKMTLSRFQLVIWTLIVLSAFLAIALERVRAGVVDPLAIELPPQLWELLGISTVSLVGSPLIQGTKVQKEPTPEAIKKAALLYVRQEKNAKYRTLEKQTDIINENVKTCGILDCNKEIGDAKFSDMFTGDEVANKGLVDMAKVQMFFFTLIIAFSYMVLLANLIMTAEPAALGSFPALTDSVVALLGISSAGYLTSKVPDKTKTK